MPATLDQLLRQPELDLTVLAGDVSRAAPVRWVAVSELEDPTPYLLGGELLLTTGMRPPRGKAAADAYVARLVEAGVVALGFGVGVVRARVPAALLSSATAYGLPLIEVGKPTPFIAISKAVGDLLAAEQLHDLSAEREVQQELTRAAVRRGSAGVVGRLATALGGWVALLDAHGDVVHAAPRDVATRDPRWAADVARIEGRSATTVTTVDEDETRVVQPLGTGGRVGGYLVTGQPGGTPPTLHRPTINVAAALLSFASARAGETGPGREARASLAGLAMEHPDVVAGRLAALGGPVLGSDRIWVVWVGGSAAEAEQLHRRCEDEGTAHSFPWQDGGEVGVVVATVEQRDRVLGLVGGDLVAGVSGTAAPAALATAVRQARRAQRAATVAGVRSRLFDDLAGAGLLGIVDAAAGAALADALLEPLASYEADSGVPLRDSVRTWLRHHGQFDPAAAALGIHRHTLRYRVRKAAQLLDRDLDDPDTRMELWFALTVQNGQPLPPG